MDVSKIRGENHQNGWFITYNNGEPVIKMDDLGGTIIFENTHINKIVHIVGGLTIGGLGDLFHD